MLRTLRVAAVLLLAPSVASAEVCNSTGSFVWSSIGKGLWSCGPGTSQDAYVVGAGHTVTIYDDLTLGASATAGITMSGPRYTCERGSGSE